MILSIRHIGLLAGMIAVLTSFLFVGRLHDLYWLMLLGGLFISGICFLWILIGKGTAKSKLIWTGMVGLGVVLNLLTESYLTHSSFLIYLHQHRKQLAATNNILKKKVGEIWIMNDSIKVKNGTSLTPLEKQILLEEKKKLGTYMIFKSDKNIYYGLWGFLDVRLGITYSISGTKPSEKTTPLYGNWFY